MRKIFLFYLLFLLVAPLQLVFANEASEAEIYVPGYWLSDPWDLSPITNVEDSFIEYCACARNGADVKVKTAITTSTSTTPSASDFAYATSSQSLPNVLAGDNLYGKYLWLKIELEPNWGATSTPCLCRINLAINNVGTTTSAHNALQNLEYTYDAAGNITQIEDYSGFGGHKTVDYTYDDLYRMLTASTTAPANGGYKETYTYDRVGNILTGPQGTYTYGETGYTNPHGATQVGSASLTYDNNGNVTVHGSNSYEWSYRDRLTKSTVGGLTTFYGYDFNNQRVAKGNGTATTTYVGKYYETTNATTTKYIFDNNGVLLATVEGNGSATSTNYIHQDHLNSTTITTDEDGDVTSSKDYLPFGSTRIESGSADVARGYIGEFQDADNFSYLNARYYQSDRGQFLSQDPVFWESPARQNLENPQSLNSYSYGENNPINNEDSTGLASEESVVGNIAGLIGGAIKGILAAPVRAVVGVLSAISDFQGTIQNIGSSISSIPSATKETISNIKSAETFSEGYTATQGVGEVLGPAVLGGGVVTKTLTTPTKVKVTSPYVRPSNATTQAQRDYVRGKSCVGCGAPGTVANHNRELVKEYYETGAVDLSFMRSLEAVSSHCATCSARQGGFMSQYSRQKRAELGL